MKPLCRTRTHQPCRLHIGTRAHRHSGANLIQWGGLPNNQRVSAQRPQARFRTYATSNQPVGKSNQQQNGSSLRRKCPRYQFIHRANPKWHQDLHHPRGTQVRFLSSPFRFTSSLTTFPFSVSHIKSTLSI